MNYKLKTQPYLVNTLFFVLMVFVAKIIVTFSYIESGLTINSILKSFLETLVATSFISLLTFPIYAIIRIFSRNASIVATSVIMAIFLLTETSLDLFTIKSGALMDNEIFLRPFNEIIETVISGVGNIWLLLSTSFLSIALYCAFSYYLIKKVNPKQTFLTILSACIVISSSFIWILPRLETTNDPNVRNYITNKTCYLMKSALITDELIENNVTYDETLINEYIEMRSDYDIPDKHYPMEYIDNVKDNLSQYFNDSDTNPNVVMIIVESLGNEWMGTNNSISPMMPFLDSLSKKSLYWKNCMSTTLRSFGAVPAITGSVPCGIRGYQFGNMPETNTLIGILKSNGYETNAFYSGEFYFDCVAEYLISQKIDYMSNFYAEYKNSNDKNKGNYWGFHDEFLFDRSIEVLNDKQSPMFNLFITISTHDDIDENNPIFAEAVRKTRHIFEESKANKKLQNVYKKAITFVYTDDCLRKFFDDYSKRDDFENTIFVITGDHASGFLMTSDISRYHVPLIVYSPLLKENKCFDNVVTHNDLVPSLVTLLKNKYHINTPDKASWAGRYLGIDEHESESEMLFVEYAKGVTKMLSNGYIYVKEDDKTYKINEEDMSISDASNEAYHEIIKHKFDVHKYVSDYVYLNDKLISENIFAPEEYKLISQHNSSKTIECQIPENKKWINFFLMPETEIKGEWEKIKLSFSAEVAFFDEIEADQYMDLYFYCSGNNHNYPDYYTDKIVKFFPVDKIELGEWYKLEVEKEFVVKDATDLKCYIYTYYSKMLDSNKALFKNVKVDVSGI